MKNSTERIENNFQKMLPKKKNETEMENRRKNR